MDASTINANTGLLSRSVDPQSYGTLANPWAAFFGNGNINQTQGAGRDYARRIDDLPFAYAQDYDNNVIGTIIEGLVQLDLDYVLTLAYPLTVSNELNFTVIRHIFPKGIATPVPNQGVSNILKHLTKTTNSASLRYGVAINMESEYATTKIGADTFLRCITQARLSAQLAMQVEVLVTILNSQTSEKQWQRAYGYKSSSADALMQREVEHFALLNKRSDALTLIHADVTSRAEALSSKVTMYIFPDKLPIVYTNSHPGRMNYMAAGPDGVLRATVGPQYLTKISGVPVFKVPSFGPDLENLKLVTELTHEVVTGEYYLQVDHRKDGDQSKRTSEDRNVILYCQTKDDLFQMRLLDGIKACGIFNPETGELNMQYHRKFIGSRRYTPMFTITVNDTGFNVPVLHFGDMRAEHLTSRDISNVVTSIVSHVSTEILNDINYLVGVYKSIRDTPPWAFVDDIRTQEAASPSGYAFRQALEEWHANPGRDLRICMQAMTSNDIMGTCELATYFGLELLADKDPIIRRCLTSFSIFLDKLASVFSTDNPLLDPAKCPAHLKGFVRNERDANAFEHLFGFQTTPLYSVHTRAANVVPEEKDTRGGDSAELKRKRRDAREKLQKEFPAFRDRIQAAEHAVVYLHSHIVSIKRWREKFGVNRSVIGALETVYRAMVEALGVLSDDNVPGDLKQSIIEAAQNLIDFASEAYVVLETEQVDDAHELMVLFNSFVEMMRAKMETKQDMSLSDLASDDDFMGEVIAHINSNTTIAKYANQWRADSSALAARARAGGAPRDVRVEGTLGLANAVAGKHVPFATTEKALRNATHMRFYDAYALVLLNPLTGFVGYVDMQPGNVQMVIDEMEKRIPLRHGRAGKIQKSMDDTNERYRGGGGGGGGALAGRGGAVYRIDDDDDDIGGGAAAAAMDPDISFDPSRGRGRGSAGASYGEAPPKRVNFSSDLAEEAFAEAPLHYTSIPSFAANFGQMLDESDAPRRMACAIFLFARYNLPTFERMHSVNHVVIPFSLVYFRLHDYHVMKGGVAMEGGGAAGRSFFGRSNAAFGFDPQTKTSMLNFTYWFVPVTINPDKVQLIPCMAYDGYWGGHNLAFMTADDIAEWRKNDFLPWNRDEHRPSLLPVGISYNEEFSDYRLDCRGVPVGDRLGKKNKLAFNSGLSYSSAEYYSDLYYFSEMTNKAPPGTMFRTTAPQPVTVMFEGFYARCSGPGEFKDVHINTGHHGRSVGKGCKAVRGGFVANLPEMNYLRESGLTLV